MQPGIRWKSHTNYVDIDTGEQLTQKEAKQYIIIKTTKHGTINRIETKGIIEYTKQCRRNPQGKLGFN